MESTDLSDVHELNGSSYDVDGDGDKFEDVATFLDTDVAEDDGQIEEYQDLTSMSSSLQQLQQNENKESGRYGEVKNGFVAQDLTLLSERSSFPSGAVLQMVLNERQQDQHEYKNEDNSPTHEQVSPRDERQSQNEKVWRRDATENERLVDVKVKSNEGEVLIDETFDAVMVSTPNIQKSEVTDYRRNIHEMPLAPSTSETTSDNIEASSTLSTLPCPAPTTIPIMIGSMNPTENDSDDSDDSEGEDDGQNIPLPPPLQLNSLDGDHDDDDVLEVDAAVISSIQIEENQRLSKHPLTTSKKAISVDGENALLKALPQTKDEDLGVIGLAFGGEVRVAHVTTQESSRLHEDTTFGIPYQSMRKKLDEFHVDEKESGYSLPSGPSFPDEREYEKEIALTNDLSFSVATTATKSAAHVEDDEFAFDLKAESDSNLLSKDVLEARKEKLKLRKQKEEEELVKELKRATDKEKELIQSNNLIERIESKTTETATNADTLSLTELHSIYKRGLGDQEVLMTDDEKKTMTESAVDRSTSVMGRIFSPTQGKTDTIVEEVDGDDSESDDAADNREGLNDNATDGIPIQDKSDDNESAEWREIKLVQHRPWQDDATTGITSVTQISYTDAASYYAETPDVMQHRDHIVPEEIPRGLCINCFSRPRLTFAGAIDERDRIFCIAATAFDAHNDVVVGMLQTFYRKVTQSSRDVLLIGRHWEDVGFQGTDPTTDFRGCGVLSLLQMLYLVETYPDLAHRFHALSQHPTRSFPFACVLINITLQCVISLRSGALYPECNKFASVLSGINRLFVALTSQLHDAMQSRSDAIPLVMKDVLDQGQSNPKQVIHEAFDGSMLRPSRATVATGPSHPKASDDNALEFTEIGLHEEG